MSPPAATPNPRELRHELRLAAVGRVQRLSCALRPRCLDLAAKSGWASWSCLDCSVEIEAPITPAEVRVAGALAAVVCSGDNGTYGPDRRTREFRRLR